LNRHIYVIADQGYESFNSIAHIQEKGWFFLIRVKDNSGIRQGLELPETDCFNVDISLKLTRKKTNEVKELLKDKNHYRMVSSTQPFDYLPLNNKRAEPAKFYELNFHTKKVMCILQEIYAHMIMYNFAEMITSHVVIEKKQRISFL